MEPSVARPNPLWARRFSMGDGKVMVYSYWTPGRRIQCFSIDVQLTGFSGDGFTRQGDTPLHVVLCFV